MQTPVDEQFVEEAGRFALRFSCEHCVYFDPAGEICSEGYPNHEHRSANLVGRAIVVFCKSFEL
jgi:hypothetical protein